MKMKQFAKVDGKKRMKHKDEFLFPKLSDVAQLCPHSNHWEDGIETHVSCGVTSKMCPEKTWLSKQLMSKRGKTKRGERRMN